jgi:hypothetical protein
MTTTPGNASSNLPGKPPVVDLATWQAAREELLVREKAHTREGDAIAAARRRLSMVELDGAVEVTGVDGPVPFVDLFQGRDELVVYHSMWYDGAPHQGQCEGCTFNLWHMDDAVYLNARGVSFAVLTSGPWDEVAPRQRAGRRLPGPARHDALRPPRGVGGQPRGLARGPSSRLAGRWAWRTDLLVLALGRRRRRHLGPDRPPGAAVDPPRRDPRGDPRPPGRSPLTQVPSGSTWLPPTFSGSL